ncbi:MULTISPECIES: fumarylacetoacetate hydrolase family protein [Burkholderia cepacia complex]|uniref:fumarylacetoacetate hydrolase family protein n=1 Tax=Burkholderia cepacia complex TaxID=87882 RepID=UPI000B768408|nr:fumarylacetoacetate hydrolase family protein [Burkholderia metallica]OUE42595.1 2-hydroxyhepta-2,4-diene-1,7-dioate isomerase [Burkholderia territorii]HDR9501111.1 fumarylacetoacetate hydrolase family protein [Burkholderia cepacia]
MKLLRYGPVGQERPGIVDAEGRIRSLWPAIADLTPDVISPEGLKVLGALDVKRLPLVEEPQRFGVPVAGVRQFFAIGLNYQGHIEEARAAGITAPDEPLTFNKAITSLSGPDDDIVLPLGAKAGDWEIELAVVIGSKAERVPVERALDYVAGYALANDVSERDWQMKRGGQFVKGKSAPSFGPVGPWLVTKDEISDPQNIDLRLEVNGTQRQQTNTSDMVFNVRYIVAHLSELMTLLPGDVILTGTPSGVGGGMKPPLYLKGGDVVELFSPQLGKQRQLVRVLD